MVMFTRLERARKQFPETLDSSQADGVQMEQHLVTLLRTGHPKIKNPEVMIKDLLALVLPDLSVHEDTIRTTLKENSLRRKILRRKSLLFRKCITVCLRFAKDPLNDAQAIGTMFCQ